MVVTSIASVFGAYWLTGNALKIRFYSILCRILRYTVLSTAKVCEKIRGVRVMRSSMVNIYGLWVMYVVSGNYTEIARIRDLPADKPLIDVMIYRMVRGVG